MSISNRKRSSVSRLVGGLVRSISADIEMKPDPLGSRYGVNKFGWVIRHSSFEELKKIHTELLIKLPLNEGQMIDGVYVGLGKPFELSHFGLPGQGELHISFH